MANNGNGNGNINNLKLSEDFLRDYEEFCAKFDPLDNFSGPQMNELTSSFHEKHRHYLESLPFTISTKYPNLSAAERVEEDALICATTPDDFKVPQWAQVVAEVYRRLTQAHYLYVTYRKSRHNEELDRMEGVEFGRRALRYDPGSFVVNWLFMVANGWYLESVSNPKERTMGAKTLCEAIKRTIRLNPEHHIAHHLLGRFYYNVASLTWLERTLANKLLGGKLEGDFKDAERQFLHSHQLGGGWLPNGLFMARTLHAQKRPLEEVKKWLDFAMEQGDVDPTTELDRRDLLEFRTKLKLTN